MHGQLLINVEDFPRIAVRVLEPSLVLPGETTAGLFSSSVLIPLLLIRRFHFESSSGESISMPK